MFDALKVFEGADKRSPHLQHPRARRTAPAFETVGRREGRDRGPRAVRLHRRHAGGAAGSGEIAGRTAGGDAGGAAVRGAWPAGHVVHAYPPSLRSREKKLTYPSQEWHQSILMPIVLSAFVENAPTV